MAYPEINDELEILVKNSHKLNSLCRICLAENTAQSTSLSEIRDSVSISERVTLCTRVEMLDEAGLPRAICSPCAQELRAADGFRLKCQHSDQLLRKYFLRRLLKSEEPDRTEEWSAVKKEEATADTPLLQHVEEAEDKSPPESVGKLKKRKKRERATVQENGIVELETGLDSDVIKVETEDIDSHFGDSANIVSDSVDEEDSLQKVTKRKYNKNVYKESEGDSIIKGKKFKCHLCGKPLSSKYTIEKHIARMHGPRDGKRGNATGFGASRRFQCPECPYSTPHSQSLRYHARTHSGERPHRCPTCARCFSQPASLACHLKTHSDRTYFTCALCGKQFKYKETYEMHKNVHSEVRRFVCSICDKGLKSRAALEGHMNRHYNIRNYSCETCGSTFVTRVELLNHAKRHSAEKKFQCNYCDFRAYVKKSLDTHLLRHSGERNFKCELCGAACYTRGELKCHARTHTKEKNYSCPVCAIKFIHSTSVNKHMLKTHGIKYRRNDTLDRRVIK